LSVSEAFDHIAGYTIVADLSVPHTSLYRPSVRFRARDNFCVIGPTVVSRRHVSNPDDLSISVSVDGAAPYTASTSTSVRGVAQLLADVTDFMTLSAGDVITLGVPHGAPVVNAGARAILAIDDWAPLSIDFIALQTTQTPQGAQA